MALVTGARVNNVTRFKGFVTVVERSGTGGVRLKGEIMSGHRLFANAVDFVQMALLE